MHTKHTQSPGANPGLLNPFRRNACCGLLAFTVAISGLAAAAVAQADVIGSGACSTSSGFDEQTATAAALQACGVTKIALSDAEPLPGGGVDYQYDLPDGQVVSYPQTPSNFDALTMTPADYEAYGLPQAPPMVSTAYSSWASEAQRWHLDPGGAPFIYQTAAVTDSAGANWSGYENLAPGWTVADAAWTEPTLGNTSCSDPAVSFWAGIGGDDGDTDLGQDGTATGAGAPAQHSAFFEVVKNGNDPGRSYFQNAGQNLTVAPGAGVTALTQYSSGKYSFTLTVNGNPFYGSLSGAFNSSLTTAEEIVERPSINNVPAPLLNFNHITISGYNGQGLSPIASHAYEEDTMSGYDTVGPLSGATFTVTQNHCNG